jgi:FMN phosphatase YigB (HAD superfamily)
MFEPCHKRVGLVSLFDETWNCKDFSAFKINSEIYKLAAEKIGCGVEDIAFFMIIL